MNDLKFKDNQLTRADTLIYKAVNILSTQIGYLKYAPDFGIDYNLFFTQDLKIQTETFRSYAISKLAENGINPVDVLTIEEALESFINIQISN